jgi:peptidoglycan/xylan/chitin deacetylase (PgdA/CDA1 family)
MRVVTCFQSCSMAAEVEAGSGVISARAGLVGLSAGMLRQIGRGAARRMMNLPWRVPGYLEGVRRLRAGSIGIIAYHGVTAQKLTVPNECQTAADDFARQMDHLVQHFRVLHLAEVIDRLRRGLALPERTVCVTFDDGFRNVATTAYPVLRKRQIPATVFLVTGSIGTRQPTWADRLRYSVANSAVAHFVFRNVEWGLESESARAEAAGRLSSWLKQLPNEVREEQLSALQDILGSPEVPEDSPLSTLDWAEIDELAGSGLVQFGSHTHTHPILSRCPPGVQRQELKRSREVLLERGLAADLFAYPNGGVSDFTDQTQELLRDLGYFCALSMLPGLNRRGTDVYALRRIGVGHRTPDHEFALRMVGL